MHIEILEKIDRKKILEEANNIKIALGLSWKDIEDVGLQAHKPDLDPNEEWQSSIKRKEKFQYPETYFKYQLFDAPLINRIIDKYGMVRTRIVKSKAVSCTTFNRKMTKRIYIPLMTNPDNRIIIENNVYNFETGNIYLVDTTLPHAAVNASQKHGVHIQGCIYG